MNQQKDKPTDPVAAIATSRAVELALTVLGEHLHDNPYKQLVIGRERRLFLMPSTNVRSIAYQEKDGQGYTFATVAGSRQG